MYAYIFKNDSYGIYGIFTLKTDFIIILEDIIHKIIFHFRHKHFVKINEFNGRYLTPILGRC